MIISKFAFKIKDAMKKYSMPSNKDPVLIGLSGGADSVCLVHVLRELNFEVAAAHINHCLRGKESEKDELFVKKMCENLGIELFIKKINLKELSKKTKTGIEECGRKVRYGFFSEIAEKSNQKIATAHTLSDSAETILMNLIRGSGSSGLCGIPPVCGNIIRPLIEVTRSEIEEYLSENNISYVQDSSNFSKEYTRNKIRIDAIPIFKKINPNFEAGIKRFTENLKRDDFFLESLAEKEFLNSKKGNAFDLNKLKKLPESLKFRVSKKIAENFEKEKEVNFKHIEMIVKVINSEVKSAKISKNTTFVKNDDALKLLQKKGLTKSKKAFIIRDVSALEFEKIKKEGIFTENCIDLEKIPKNCTFRSRSAGDFFKLNRRNITKKIKKLFSEMKIPEEERENLIFLAHNNEVVWIDGIGVSGNFAPSERTRQFGLIEEKLKISELEE